MAILKSTILTFVNSKLHVSETDIDAEIQEVLDDLSEQDLLTATFTAPDGGLSDLAAGTTTIPKPTLYKLLVDITLNNGSLDLAPLVGLPGGMVELRRLLRDSVSQSTPEWYVEFGSKFYLYPISSGVFTPTIEYYKFHAGTGDNSGADAIEFGDEFTMSIKTGTCLHIATKKRMAEQMLVWGTKYSNERQKRIDNNTDQAYIVGGADGRTRR